MIYIITERRHDVSPKPIDTSDVQFPAEPSELTETIAENVHDVWVASRIAEGRSYGEKAYDRNKTMETVRLIVKLGYEIRKM